MPRSMTGFGAALAETGGGSATVEIRTVNHRHLDIRWHGFADHPALVVEAERDLKQALQRGRVDVRLHVAAGAASRSGELDEEAVRRRVAQIRRLAGELGLEDDLRASSLLSLGPSFVLGEEGAVAVEAVDEGLLQALRSALEQVTRMRDTEGRRTVEDLEQRLDRLSSLLDRGEVLRQGGIEQRMTRLQARIRELLEGRKLDEDRMHQELALLADRTDVSEELERARGHVAHFRSHLRGEGVVGRKLDFLVQELGREINTMGSKAHELSEVVVELKSELEKLREQVQNLE